jgi:hypothetical protein
VQDPAGEVRREYEDADITFYLQVYRDAPDAEACLREVRRHYPGSRVIVLSDGDDDPRFARLAERFGAEYTAGERLYGIEHGGKMIQRMFDAFLLRPSDYLFKIDTDTRIHRRFRYLPTGCIAFGTLEWETARSGTRLDFPSIQGGCTGFTLEAARRIAESGLLLSDELLDYRRTYADNADAVSRARRRGMISTDFVTRYACRRLEIPLVEFDEVRSLYCGKIAPDGEGFAVTHPHKAPPFWTWRRLKSLLRWLEMRIRETIRGDEYRNR